jgi:hypothetical protein
MIDAEHLREPAPPSPLDMQMALPDAISAGALPFHTNRSVDYPVDSEPAALDERVFLWIATVATVGLLIAVAAAVAFWWLG